MIMNIIWEINNRITYFLHNLVVENKLEWIIAFFADTPIFFLPIFLLFVWLYSNFKTKNESEKEWALLITYSVLISIIFNSIIKLFVIEERPDSIITPILKHVPDNSFPSDHATVSFAFLFAIYAAGYKKTFWLFMPFVIIMNFSRIAWGLHWFFDILVWALLWLFAVIFIFKIKNNQIISKLNLFIIKIMSYIKL